MERTKTIKKADAILTGDYHLREDTPVCRLDDFQTTQWRKVRFISELQRTHDCPVIHSGDLFNHWKPSPWLLSKAAEYLPKQFYTIYGNHDLPQHNLELREKCGIYNLEMNGRLTVLPGVHWGQGPKGVVSLIIKGRTILVYHVMTYQGKKPWPGCTDPMAALLLRKLSADLLLTGHNHKPFVETYENKLMVNPGSPMRQEAGQINHKPRVYLYYADTNTVEPVYLPIEDGVITRVHIEKDEQRDDRIEAFISRLDGDWEASLSFEANLEAFYQKNEIRTSVKDIITKSLDK